MTRSDRPALGVVFRPQSPPEQLREVAVAADDAGLDQLWLWEDCFAEGGPTAAAAALAWTGRLRVGIGLLPVPLRNPALAAMEIATLARMFPDRLLPGLGHGVLDWMSQVGARAGSPMTLLREHTSAVRDLLHGRTVGVEGRYVRLDGVALDWPPSVAPPVLLGARGPKTLRLAGELADGVILDAVATVDTVRAARAETDDARSAAGRTDAFTVVVFVELDRPSPAQVRDRAGAFADAGADVVVLQGTAEAPDPHALIAACTGG